jgi:virginiamycin B lyase
MPGTTSQFKASVPLAYIETTIPSGTTIGEYRRSRPQRRSRWHWLRHLPGRRWTSRQWFRRDDRARHAISIGAIVVLSLLFAGSAEAHVYWTNNADTTIGRANLDGTGVNQSLISGGFNPCGVAVDGAHVYWGNIGAGTIGRANLDGSGANQSFIGGPVGPCGVAVDGAHVYWADTNGTAIGRANLDGSGVNPGFIDNIDAPCGVTVDGAHVYWGTVAAGTIGRANLDGSGVNQGFIGGATGACGVAVDAAHVYWSNGGAGTIGRGNLDGTGVNQGFIAGAPRPCGVALDGAHLFWTNADDGTIGRANLDGTGVNQGFIGGATMPCGVAVDADPTGGVEDPGGGGGVITNPPPPVGGGGVITNPPAPVDTVAQLPTVGNIKVARRHRRLVARVPVSCPTGEAGGCRTTLRLATAKKIRRGRVRTAVVLGSKEVNLGPGQRLTVSIRLARSAAGLARRGTLATRIRITSSDAAGNSAARLVTRRLRIPRR